jgi:hypothetical protein
MQPFRSAERVTRPTRRRAVLAIAAVCVALPGLPRGEEDGMSRDYVSDPETDWRYLSDQVMGGVSEGTAERLPTGTIRLEGRVSTENRGGFIQVRTTLETRLPVSARGVALEARGNGERYFVHLRTAGTRLPWQYYQAGFDTGPDWREIRLAFDAFRPSGRLLRATPRPEQVTSIGLVAYGRDHAAELDVRRLTIW